MLKAKIIITAIKALLWIVLLGVGVWYLSSSIGGGAITYTSLDSFLHATGACTINEAGEVICNIASTNACFLCPYIERLFYTIGQAAFMFWDAIIDNVWILLSLGFAIFLFVHTAKEISKQNKQTADMKADDRKFDFGEWFKGVWPQAFRVLLVGALIGAIGYGGTRSIKLVADVTITPVMFLGSELAMAATGISSSASCGSGKLRTENSELKTDPQLSDISSQFSDIDIMGPAMKPFMCAIGNLNTVILAGAAGGFSLMNYSWMDLGGGLFTWIAGLALVIMFLVIGFDVFFKILTVVFQLVFLIIFLPLFIAAWAYEDAWPLLKGIFSKAIGMLVNSAVRIIGITLKILILYAMVLFAADEYFPPPRDGYSAILPAGIALNQSTVYTPTNIDDRAASVMEVFSKCEKVGTDNGTRDMDKDKFKLCFMQEKYQVEAQHPGAFDFMDDGISFILMMIGMFLIYWYVIKEQIDQMLGGEDGQFDFGKSVKEFGQKIWSWPQQMLGKIGSAVGNN